MSKYLGIDLGTANTLVYMKGKGIILREPSVVAVNQAKKKVVAVGSEAKSMIGKTPGSIEAFHPLRDGVIADFDVTAKMLRSFFTKVNALGVVSRPTVVICIPNGVTEVGRRAVEDATFEAGAKNVALIDEPMAAAIGAGLRISEARGSMIVDIGGGTTEIAVMSLGGIAVAKSLRVGGDTFDEALCAYIRRKYNVTVSESSAEYCKRTIGTVIRPEDSLVRRAQEALPGSPVGLRVPKEMEIRGRNIITGLPVTLKLTPEDMVEASAEPTAQIIDSIRAVLEMTPPELSSDLIGEGILLSGGGALLGGLSQRIAQATHLRVAIAKNPTECSVQGLGKLLEFNGDVDRIIKFRTK